MTAPFGVVIPIRAFRLGNTRLAVALDDDARTGLARRLAEQVVTAARGAPVVIVTGAPEVVEWARGLGLAIVDDPGSLDAAATAGVAALYARGCRRTVVAHADLPLVTGFHAVTRDAGEPVAAIVPCHHDDGTPIISIPAGAAFTFTFAYGPGSFRHHVHAARRAGLAVRVVRDPSMGFDVDTVDDITALAERDPSLLGLHPATESPS